MISYASLIEEEAPDYISHTRCV